MVLFVYGIIYLFIFFLEMSYLIYYLKKIRYVILIKFLNIEYNLNLIMCVCVENCEVSKLMWQKIIRLTKKMFSVLYYYRL